MFRDRLRSNESDRAEYERAKRELAGHWRDMNHYARAKGTVIERMLARADKHVDVVSGRVSGLERRSRPWHKWYWVATYHNWSVISTCATLRSRLRRFRPARTGSSESHA